MTTDEDKPNHPIQDFILDVIVPGFAIIMPLLGLGAALYFWYDILRH
ncbi:hypothetical protein [Methyloglobulus sp.]|jgi:hypothetical protein